MKRSESRSKTSNGFFEPRCAWGYNDQDPRSHSTNGHLAKATKVFYVRLNGAIVLRVGLCDEHHDEIVKSGRWMLIDPRRLTPVSRAAVLRSQVA